MPPRETARWILCILVCAALAGCSWFDAGGKKVDYKSAGQTAPLEVPPDLLRPGTDDRFRVPDINPTGTATFSDYSRDRAGKPRAGAPGVLPEIAGVRVVREGNQRWLVVKGPPDQVWLTVKDFWQESGFIVNVEVPEAGVLETDWAEKRARIKDAGWIRDFLSWALDQTYSSGERDKFRTRLERGVEPGTTEIFISHRRMEEVITGPGTPQPDIRWQPRPSDPDLEAEMLRRLMARFGVDDAQAKSQIASAQAAPPRATLSRGDDGAGMLALNEQFDRAWRRVGLALDRVGFTVDDRDRSKGVYYVRYIDPQVDGTGDQGGFFSKLKFWGSDKPKPNERFRIEVKDANAAGCQVNVLNQDGTRERSDTAGRILALLYEQLK